MDDSQLTWVRPGGLTGGQRGGLADLFAGVAGDFVPPLTTRSGTVQTDLRDSGQPAAENDDYFEQMLDQDIILAGEDGSLTGFLSFRAFHEDARYPDHSPCLYVSTIAVRPDQRRSGVARRLYAGLFGLPSTLPSWVVLRTWSTNSGHLKLLAELGFITILTIQDDRAEGIDTLYLAADRHLAVGALGADAHRATHQSPEPQWHTVPGSSTSGVS